MQIEDTITATMASERISLLTVELILCDVMEDSSAPS